jgi:phosphatidylglycerol---prolipoprotein diacylglyceryl transferase
MCPILLSANGLTIYTYGVFVSLGMLLSLWYCRTQSLRMGLPPNRIWNLGLLMIVAGLTTSKAWLVLSSQGHGGKTPTNLTEVCVHSGGVYYGGLFGAGLALCIYAHGRKLSILPLCDLFAMGLPLGHSIVKLGCLAAGCCYGSRTTRAWGIVYTNPIAHQLAGTPLNTALQPVQLCEAGMEFCIFLILTRMANRPRAVGSVGATYLLLYGIARALIEPLRGDPGRIMILGGVASQFQLISLCIAVFGALFIVHQSKSHKFVSNQ